MSGLTCACAAPRAPAPAAASTDKGEIEQRDGTISESMFFILYRVFDVR